MIAQTIYYKRINSAGKVSIETARVWSADRYLTRLKKDAATNAIKDGVVADKIEPATEAEYYNSIKRK